MISTTKNEVSHLIKGPAGQLEVIQSPPTGNGRRATGIVCHPHSLFGGTMQNKVVTTLAKAFQALGLIAIRFNFRGVGLSSGQFDNGHGELDDLLAVMEWILEETPQHEIWLAGFSFGAYVAAQAATKIPLSKLVLVAPPVNHFSFQKLPPFLGPWILVQGDKDEVIPAGEVFTWAEKRNPSPTILRFPEATHFFHGQLVDLRIRVEEELAKN